MINDDYGKDFEPGEIVYHNGIRKTVESMVPLSGVFWCVWFEGTKLQRENVYRMALSRFPTAKFECGDLVLIKGATTPLTVSYLWYDGFISVECTTPDGTTVQHVYHHTDLVHYENKLESIDQKLLLMSQRALGIQPQSRFQGRPACDLRQWAECEESQRSADRSEVPQLLSARKMDN
jgi:uncharacterized protein YodC (DUF2158 family)